MSVNTTLQRATKSVPNKGQLTIHFTINQGGAALSLSGLTLTAKIRREDFPDTVVHASLESHEMTITDASSGAVDLVLSSAEMQLLDAPTEYAKSWWYIITVTCSDGYTPDPYGIPVHRAG